MYFVSRINLVIVPLRTVDENKNLDCAYQSYLYKKEGVQEK